jgi:hypothetical protein
MRLYRAMRVAADGLPEVAPSARALGVRPGNASHPDVAAIQPDDLVRPGEGGMSVAPDDPVRLARNRRPANLGGRGPDPVWWIEADVLGPSLVTRFDPPTHGFVEPAAEMTLLQFELALAATRPHWALY